MHPQPLFHTIAPPTSTDTSATGTLASSTVCRAILIVTDGLGPRLFSALEVVLYFVYFCCFIGLAWLQIATNTSREGASASVALHAVCCVTGAVLVVGELAQIKVFRVAEFKGVRQKFDALNEGFMAYHYGAGVFLTFVVLLAGILVRARTAQSTPHV